MKLTYNAPVVLTFALISAGVLLIDTIFGCGNIEQVSNINDCMLKPYFMTLGVFDFSNPMDYIRLVTHTMGHANWAHLLGNFSIILLIGPLLEEKFGSLSLLFMMVVTAVATAVLDIAIWDNGGLGASGIVFMMILLSSFTNYKSGTVPITFVLVVVLYLGQEIYNAFGDDNISQFAHIMGGILGAAFGFVSQGMSGGSDNSGPKETAPPSPAETYTPPQSPL